MVHSLHESLSLLRITSNAPSATTADASKHKWVVILAAFILLAEAPTGM
jgi:hypothetical protein